MTDRLLSEREIDDVLERIAKGAYRDRIETALRAGNVLVRGGSAPAPATCEDECNPYIAPTCGAKFCTDEAMQHHERTTHEQQAPTVQSEAATAREVDSRSRVPGTDAVRSEAGVVTPEAAPAGPPQKLLKLVEDTFQRVWSEIPLHRRAQMMSEGFSFDPTYRAVSAAEAQRSTLAPQLAHWQCINCEDAHNGEWLAEGHVGPFCARCKAAAEAQRSALVEKLRTLPWHHLLNLTACHYPGGDKPCDNPQHYFVTRAELNALLPGSTETPDGQKPQV